MTMNTNQTLWFGLLIYVHREPTLKRKPFLNLANRNAGALADITKAKVRQANMKAIPRQSPHLPEQRVKWYTMLYLLGVLKPISIFRFKMHTDETTF